LDPLDPPPPPDLPDFPLPEEEVLELPLLEEEPEYHPGLSPPQAPCQPSPLLDDDDGPLPLLPDLPEPFPLLPDLPPPPPLLPDFPEEEELVLLDSHAWGGPYQP